MSSTPSARKTDSDLGGRDNTLALIPWTDEQRERNEFLAERCIARHFPDDDGAVIMLMQMLGMAPYEKAKRPQPSTPIKHGTRGGFTNRGCGKEGSPPCPATPSCRDEDRAYWRERREAGRVDHTARRQMPSRKKAA